MKEFEIKVTQDLHGYYEGTIVIEAKNKQSALNKLKKMSKDEIDNQADWTHGDQYDRDKETIEIDEDSVEEV